MEYIIDIRKNYTCVVIEESENVNDNIPNGDNEMNIKENKMEINKKVYQFNKILKIIKKETFTEEVYSKLLLHNLNSHENCNIILLSPKKRLLILQILNELLSNKNQSKITQLFYSNFCFNINSNLIYDIINNNQKINNYKLVANEIITKEITLHDIQCKEINCEIFLVNIEYENKISSEINFVIIRGIKEQILPLFSINYNPKNSLQYINSRINALIVYQNELSHKLLNLPCISSEILNSINIYKEECVQYYNSIIEQINEFKDEIAKNTLLKSNNNLNGQNIIEKIDSFIQAQRDFIENNFRKLDNTNQKKELIELELDAYKNLLNYYLLNETNEIDKRNEQFASFTSLKDLIYHFINSNEEILSFLKVNYIPNENSNGQNIDDSKYIDEINKLKKQINYLKKENQKLQLNTQEITYYTSISQTNKQGKSRGKSVIIQENKQRTIKKSIENNKKLSTINISSSVYNKLQTSKLKISNENNFSYIEVKSQQIKNKGLIEELKKEAIERDNLISEMKQLYEVKQLQSCNEISKLKNEVNELTDQINKIQKNNSYINESQETFAPQKSPIKNSFRNKKLIKSSSCSVQRINTNDIPSSDCQRKQKEKPFMIKVNNKTNSNRICSNSMILLNRIREENKSILSQLDYFNKKNSELHAELSLLQKNNMNTNNSIIINKDELNSVNSNASCGSLNKYTNFSSHKAKKTRKVVTMHNSMKNLHLNKQLKVSPNPKKKYENK